MCVDEEVCMFWNTTSLLWSSDGCWLDEDASESDSDTVTCVCRHLTEFAVMAQSRTSKVVSSRHIHNSEKIFKIVCSCLHVCVMYVYEHKGGPGEWLQYTYLSFSGVSAVLFWVVLARIWTIIRNHQHRRW